MELGAVASLCVLIVFLVAMVKIVGIRADVRDIRRLLKKQAGEAEAEEKGKKDSKEAEAWERGKKDSKGFFMLVIGFVGFFVILYLLATYKR